MNEYGANGQEKYYVKSVMKAIDLLLCFSYQSEWTINELSRELCMNRSTVNRLLISLGAKGFLVRDPESGKYRLGLKIIEVAANLLNQMDIRKTAAPVLKELSAKCYETVDLAIWYEDQTLFIDHLESPHQVKVVSFVGQRMPAHCNAPGKVFLANLPPAELRRVLAKGLEKCTPNTVTDPAVLIKELEEIKRSDVAFDFEEHSLEISACASPIRDFRAQVVAAVSIVGPSSRINEKLKDHLAVLVKEAAKEISLRLGYQISN
jgi:DNA-binding IclR family transcriptional regulator